MAHSCKAAHRVGQGARGKCHPASLPRDPLPKDPLSQCDHKMGMWGCRTLTKKWVLLGLSLHVPLGIEMTMPHSS